MRFLLIFLTFLPFVSFSQNDKKEIIAKRIDSPVIIDGELSESFWQDIIPAENFQMMEPINGKFERSTQKTKVKFALKIMKTLKLFVYHLGKSKE